jgi:hydroxymethylglutaryl-CoA synthase
VGTESAVDRAKSIKSYMMQLFPDTAAGVEGADVVHACYGGAAALLNALAWVESEAWDGRWAVVVTTDVGFNHPDGEVLGQQLG